MAVICCNVCGGKAFVNETALRQHSLDNKKHIQRVAELKRKQTQPQAVFAAPSSNVLAQAQAASTPVVSVTPVAKYNCDKCMQDFTSQDTLDEHYKSGGSPRHPKCFRCSEGFRDHNLLEKHMRTAHPMSFCQPCQKFVYVADLEKHYAESVKHKPYPCTRCSIRFSTEELLKKHYRDDGTSWHTTCFRCWEGYEDNAALQIHISATHPRVLCRACDREVFIEDLEKHRQESANHPTCPVCNSSFEDMDAYKAHAIEVHDELCCRLCDLAFLTLEGLESHYATTENLHARCKLCGAGFRNVIVLEKHACPMAETQALSAVATPITQRSHSLAGTAPPSPIPPTCKPCERIFKNMEGLSMHFRDHSAHPKCADCKLGFEDHAAYDQHVSMAHSPRQAAVQEQSDEEITPEEEEDMTLVNAQQVEAKPKDVQDEVGSTATEPLQEEVMASDTNTPQSEHSDLQRSLVLSIPHPIIRASSEPPPLSSVFTPRVQSTGSAGDAESHAETWEDREGAPSPEEQRTPASSVSSLQSPSIKSISRTPSPKLTPQAHDKPDDTISPISSLPRSIVSPVRSGQEVGSPGELTPRDTRRFPYLWGGPSLASESTSGPGTPALARELLFNGGLAGEAPQDNARTQRERSNASSRASSVASRDSESRGRSKSPRTSSSHSTTNNTRVEREEPKTPSPHENLKVDSPRLPVSALRLSWHCRVCSGTPHEPTVTLCGHLFCRGCIIMALSKHGQCPVCRATMLVRLHVGQAD